MTNVAYPESYSQIKHAKLPSRYFQVVSFCREPKTFEEVAKKFSISYHTARREVLTLEKMGFLYETAFRRDTKKQFQANVRELVDAGLAPKFQFNQKSLSIEDVIRLLEDPYSNSIGRTMQKALSHVIQNSVLMRKGEQQLGFPTNPAYTRKAMVMYREYLQELLKLYDQLLLLDIWNHDADVLLFGKGKFDKLSAEKKLKIASHSSEWTKECPKEL